LFSSPYRFDHLPFRSILAAILLVSAIPLLGLAEEAAVDEEMHRAGRPAIQPPSALFVEPSRVTAQRSEFVSRLRGTNPRGDKRPLFEAYLPVIGANGIVAGLHEVWPACHSEGHDLGKVIFARVRDIGQSLHICGDGCHSGCMHGVVMEALTTGGLAGPSQIDRGGIGRLLQDLCRQTEAMTENYSPGDCAHGVGHALTVVTDYDVGRALAGCKAAGEVPLQYYCATGAYMEYVTERDAEDAKAKGWFYPCDSFAFPAACARYKMVHVARRHHEAGRGTAALRQQCVKLEGSRRIGCFHGLGNALMPMIARGEVSLNQACLGLVDAEERACIDGAIERMAKFHEARARQVCEAVGGVPGRICREAAARKMYDMNKDLTLYISP
jgi:hypothetical protein